MKKTLKILGITLAVIFFIMIMVAVFSSGESESNVSESNLSQDVVEQAENEGDWSYSEQKDEMDGKVTSIAELKSENEIEFEFPYNGGSSFYFHIYKSGSNYRFALAVSNGQFMPNILQEERLRIKFDDNEVFNWNYSDAADVSSDVIFPDYDAKLLANMKNSKKMMIEAPFAFAGRQIIYFNTQGLKADF